jgi:hypothetical protein
MKTKVMTLMIVALGCFAINAHAQTQNDSQIKVVPTDTPGTIKMIHAGSIDKGLIVTFSNQEGEICTDRISGSFPKGVLKRYNLSHIAGENFQMEVKSTDMTVTYRVAASKGGKKYIPTLEKVEYHPQLVASR